MFTLWGGGLFYELKEICCILIKFKVINLVYVFYIRTGSYQGRVHDSTEHEKVYFSYPNTSNVSKL